MFRRILRKGRARTRLLRTGFLSYFEEVLDGVGVDEVGGIFLLSSVLLSFFFLFLRFLSFFFEEQTNAIYWENGEFHSDPVCTDPVQNFPTPGCSSQSGGARLGVLRSEPPLALAAFPAGAAALRLEARILDADVDVKPATSGVLHLVLQFGNRPQLCTFVAFLGPLSKGNFRHKMTIIVGNRGQLWTSTLSPHFLSPHFLSPHLDFPDQSQLTERSVFNSQIWSARFSRSYTVDECSNIGSRKFNSQLPFARSALVAEFSHNRFRCEFGSQRLQFRLQRFKIARNKALRSCKDGMCSSFSLPSTLLNGVGP